jgi:3-hydroxyacyl-CoA dehydrogenase
VIGLERAARMAANGKPVSAETFEEFGGLDLVFTGDPIEALPLSVPPCPPVPPITSDRTVETAI